MKNSNLIVMTLHFILIMIGLLSAVLEKKITISSRHIQVFGFFFGSSFPCLFGL